MGRRSVKSLQRTWSVFLFLSLLVAASVSGDEEPPTDPGTEPGTDPGTEPSPEIPPAGPQSFVVHLCRRRGTIEGAFLSYRQYLATVLDTDLNSTAVDESLLYRYETAFDGFAAIIDQDQANALQEMPGVLAVIPNYRSDLATTNSWKFLGLEVAKTPNNGPVWNQTKFGQDVIIGIVDTGIWPEHPSFSDKNFTAIPSRWKGKCVDGDNFSASSNCNKKLIGAKFYYAGNPDISFEQEYNSSRDYQGHGTHVASTAAGSFVNASMNGYLNGTMKGGAPKARIAVYKVCWNQAGCYLADIAAAIEDAILDGVDVLSISISGMNEGRFTWDTVGIAAFQAMRKNITVNFAGGNSGPTAGTVNHVEPWSFTVAATTQDRYVGANVTISPYRGSPAAAGLQFRGMTASSYSNFTAPIILGSDATRYGYPLFGAFCFDGNLDPMLVEGKIVFCLRGREDESIEAKAQAVAAAGGVGLIVGNTAQMEDYTIRPIMAEIPAVYISAYDAQRVVDFFSKCDLDVCIMRNATATFSRGVTLLGDKPAPVVASFSSCGPSGVTKNILKPDIAAPGVDILAAWLNNDVSVLSGTSMATPHIAGVVALVKAANPTFTPAQIKSAIMTTAKVLDNTSNKTKNLHGKPASPFSVGAGLVDPVAAVNPGLVYDLVWTDYALFLCNLTYDDNEIQMITGEKGFCSNKTIPLSTNLNYPSVSVSDLKTTLNVNRTVTNTGPTAKATYSLTVEAPKGVKVTITPTSLAFTKLLEKKSFTIKLERSPLIVANDTQEQWVFGSYTWSDGVHKVRSPIAVGISPQYQSYEIYNKNRVNPDGFTTSF
ncbi:hypothetical protein R1flu_014291 [Riccia fluitans]|uniref:Subtilisin-like protease n=1 Tax=Riccia fluitans TaxID=41844 RepID=A0ABD1YGE1_9MARC